MPSAAKLTDDMQTHERDPYETQRDVMERCSTRLNILSLLLSILVLCFHPSIDAQEASEVALFANLCLPDLQYLFHVSQMFMVNSFIVSQFEYVYELRNTFYEFAVIRQKFGNIWYKLSVPLCIDLWIFI